MGGGQGGIGLAARLRLDYTHIMELNTGPASSVWAQSTTMVHRNGQPASSATANL